MAVASRLGLTIVVLLCSMRTSLATWRRHELRRSVPNPTLVQDRSVSLWAFLRGGGVTDEPPPTLDLAYERRPFVPLAQRYPLSVASVRGQRPKMEDEFATGPDFCAVFDGHGGPAVSRYLRQNLYAEVQAAMSRLPPDKSLKGYEGALRDAIEKVDRDVSRIKHWSFQGSTVVALWCHPDEKTLLLANVGDSRAVLSRNATALQITRDHKPNDPIERTHIESLGGAVTWHGNVDWRGQPILDRGLFRVNGGLALSRAVGDFAERPLVHADPDISRISVHALDDFVVLATDGLWDVFENDEVVDLIHCALATGDVEQDDVTSLLVEEALRRGSYDNVTVIVVWLRNLTNDDGHLAAIKVERED